MVNIPFEIFDYEIYGYAALALAAVVLSVVTIRRKAALSHWVADNALDADADEAMPLPALSVIVLTSGCDAELLACACMPDAVVWLTQLPNVVIGLILSYVVILQLAAAFSMMSEKKTVKSFDHALTIALPLIVALLVAFIPPTVGEDLPIALRPILTNGFVIGVLLVVFLEHIVFLRKN